MMKTKLARSLAQPGCAIFFIFISVALASVRVTVAYALPPPDQYLSPLTNITQWLAFTNGEASRGYPVRLEGVVTLVDTNRNLLVFQDGTGALAVNLKLQGYSFQPGQRILLKGEDASPFVATYPDYPNRPTTIEWRSLFEAPSGRGFNYAARMRGFLHPPVTGEYTFWIASDNSSDLWLSRGSDPARARRIAYVSACLSTKAREWSRLPSQRSTRIFLEAGKAYYIEAVHEQGSGPDNLAVAWEGPNIRQSVIDGSYLSPWDDDMNQRLSGGESGRTNGIFWEYFTNYPARTVQPLDSRRTPASILTFRNARIISLGISELPEAEQIDIAQPLAAKDNFRWVEVEGTVNFMAKNGGLLMLELIGNQKRMTVFVQNWPEDQIPQWQNLRVEVRGVCESTMNPNGKPVAGVVYSPSPRDISVIGAGAELWSSMAVTPICNLDPNNPDVAWGREIMVRGTVARQNRGTLLIRSDASFYGYVSSNGVDWTEVMPPVEIGMSNSVLVGLSTASFNSNTLATAIFDHVKGLAVSALDSQIDNSTPVGNASFNGSSATTKGGGRGIRGQWDQLEYLNDSVADDGEIVARVDSLKGDNPQAIAGLMIRESLDQHAPFVNLGVSLRNDVLLQFRRERDLDSITVNVPGYQMPCWLKLGYRHSFLVADVEGSSSVHLGQPVELVGFLAWEDGQPTLREARCRAADVKEDYPTAFSTPAGSSYNNGETGVTYIGQIISQNGNWRKRGGPVRIRGVITFAGQILGRDYAAIQDETAGIFIALPKGSVMLSALHVGQEVEFEGLRNGKSFEPTSLNILGLGQLPKPAIHPEEFDMMRGGEGNWTEIDGIVQSVAADGAMLVMTDAGSATARIGSTPVGSLSDYVNAFVRLRGVTSWTGENEMQLLVPSRNFIQVSEKPPRDPFIIPSIPIASVIRFGNGFQAAHRLEVKGVVTYREAGLIFLQDASGGVAVQTADAPAINAGDQVEAVGFPRYGAYSPVLIDAQVRKQKSGSMPQPVEIPMAAILQGQSDAMLVKLKAVLLGQQKLSTGDMVLDLEAESRVFRATLAKNRGSLSLIPVGSVVQVAGVCYAERVSSPDPELASENEPMIAAFNLLLRNPSDVVLLQRPPWWDWKHTVAVVACLIMVLVGTLGWVYMLRRRVAQRTRDLEIAMAKLEKETQTSATLAERQRLAGEIHDGLEQGLSGIMMQLNGVISTMNENPAEARGFVELARNMVRFSHAELRHSLLNLQSPLLAYADLGTALAEIARQMKNGINNAEIITRTTGMIRDLPPSIENHMFRIGQEAVNNALKHACAKTIDINLSYFEESVRLSVCDDGCGFNQAEVLAGTVGLHLGLRSLRERARKMGGHLTVISKPGQGTTIEVVVPFNKRNGEPT